MKTKTQKLPLSIYIVLSAAFISNIVATFFIVKFMQ